MGDRHFRRQERNISPWQRQQRWYCNHEEALRIQNNFLSAFWRWNSKAVCAGTDVQFRWGRPTWDAFLGIQQKQRSVLRLHLLHDERWEITWNVNLSSAKVVLDYEPQGHMLVSFEWNLTWRASLQEEGWLKVDWTLHREKLHHQSVWR